MSILETFDASGEEIIRPEQLVSKPDGFPEVLVTGFSRSVTDLATQLPGAVQIDTLRAGMELPIIAVRRSGKTIGVYQSLIGGAASAGLLEEVLAKGAKKVLFYGSCGALDRDLTAGRVMVPTAAFRDEGTSYHYLSASDGDFVDIPTAGRLGELLDEIGVPYLYGKTWTTDAIYRETRTNAARRLKQGCLTVEMECASVMAAAQFRGAEVYQFLYAADSLSGSRWDPRILGRLPAEEKERYLRIALEIAQRLA
ncbi:MAG: nucleoside phosphorylase [Firmicutes bacterium]|nr:nucleoside phosphorylase [Bacillota bacterium]